MTYANNSAFLRYFIRYFCGVSFGTFAVKMKELSHFLPKNLHISEKSSTFAP